MALASPYLQNVVGYPIITAGVLLASRGCGTFVAMMLVGRLMRYIEARTLIVSGLSLTAWTLYHMSGWTDQTGTNEIVVLSIAQGFGFGLVFVPLSTVAFLTLAPHLRTDGTSMLTLMRNVASSIGISVVQSGNMYFAVEDFSAAVPSVSLNEQEQQGASQLAARGLRDVSITADACHTCQLDRGYTGQRSFTRPPNFASSRTTSTAA